MVVQVYKSTRYASVQDFLSSLPQFTTSVNLTSCLTSLNFSVVSCATDGLLVSREVRRVATLMLSRAKRPPVTHTATRRTLVDGRGVVEEVYPDSLCRHRVRRTTPPLLLTHCLTALVVQS